MTVLADLLDTLAENAVAGAIFFLVGFAAGKYHNNAPESTKERTHAVLAVAMAALSVVTSVVMFLGIRDYKAAAARYEQQAAAYQRAAACQAAYNERNNQRVAALTEANQRTTLAEVKYGGAHDQYLDALARYIGQINRRGAIPGGQERAGRRYLAAVVALDAANAERARAYADLAAAREKFPPPPAACTG